MSRSIAWVLTFDQLKDVRARPLPTRSVIEVRLPLRIRREEGRDDTGPHAEAQLGLAGVRPR